MHYLERVIKESLRLYPSVPFIQRKADANVQTCTGYTVPVNTPVNIHIYDMHRNPELYPEPNRFDPDRFLPENTKGRHPFAYLPFSAGPRNCIGEWQEQYLSHSVTGLITVAASLRYCYRIMLLYMFFSGQRFAFLEMKSLISCVLRKYVMHAVDTPETVEIMPDIVLRPNRGIKIKFLRRWLGVSQIVALILIF